MNVYARKDAVGGERLLCNREVLKNRNGHCRQNSEYRKKAYCNKNIRIFGDLDIIHGLAVCYAVTLEHRNTIEFQTLDFYSRITYVMHIAVEPVNGDTIHAVIMIAANEYLLRMQKVAEPDQKSNASGLLPFMIKSPECTTCQPTASQAFACGSHACRKYAILFYVTKIKRCWLNRDTS